MATVKEIYEQLHKLLKENPETADKEVLEGGGDSARLNVFRDGPDGVITYISFEDERFMDVCVEQVKALVAEMNVGELSEQHMEYLVQMRVQETLKEKMQQFIKDYAVPVNELNKKSAVERYIRINDDISISELKLHEKGDLTGYITGQLEVDGCNLDILYRVKDIENGEPMSLVSIDYGYHHPSVKKHWADIEKAIEDFAEKSLIAFKPDFYYSFILTEEMIGVEDFEYDSIDGLFSSYLGTYFDVDNKFGVDTSNDDIWLNLYGIYNAKEDKLSVECTVNSVERQSYTFKYVPVESEKELIFNAMNDFCHKEYGKYMVDTCKEILDKEEIETGGTCEREDKEIQTLRGSLDSKINAAAGRTSADTNNKENKEIEK